MTGGTVVVLGETGKNFAAGMSGGLAFVYDQFNDFAGKCNMEMVDLEGISSEDELILQAMIQKHLDTTGSTVAAEILGNWEASLAKFVKVYPRDYKRILEERKKMF